MNSVVKNEVLLLSKGLRKDADYALSVLQQADKLDVLSPFSKSSVRVRHDIADELELESQQEEKLDIVSLRGIVRTLSCLDGVPFSAHEHESLLGGYSTIICPPLGSAILLNYLILRSKGRKTKDTDRFYGDYVPITWLPRMVIIEMGVNLYETPEADLVASILGGEIDIGNAYLPHDVAGHGMLRPGDKSETNRPNRRRCK